MENRDLGCSSHPGDGLRSQSMVTRLEGRLVIWAKITRNELWGRVLLVSCCTAFEGVGTRLKEGPPLNLAPEGWLNLFV